MSEKKYLPLGSVVYLKEGTKRVLIIARGLLVRNGDDVVFFDYGGVPYPDGVQNDKMAYFQENNIEKVVFEGYTDDEDEAVVRKIKTFIDKHPDMPYGDVNAMLEQQEEKLNK